MGRLMRTWDLLMQTLSVLFEVPSLAILPVLSGAFAVLVSISFLLPLLTGGVVERLEAEQRIPASIYAAAFVWYFLCYFGIIFFNAALVSCAYQHLSGKPVSVGDGLATAGSRVVQIGLWALVSATFSVILNLIEEQFADWGGILKRILGLAWTVVTYLVLPVLVIEDLGVYRSVKRSATLLTETWGEQLASNCAFGLLSTVMAIPIVVLSLMLGRSHLLAAILFAAFGMVSMAIINSAARGIFMAALYRYATAGETSGGIGAEFVKDAFSRSDRD